MTNLPVLIVIFNRPDKFRNLLQSLRKSKPSKLFVSADGPRQNNADDKSKCVQARKVVDEIDWPCDIVTRFLDNNMGCDPHVASAIEWFFENVEYGIILEDDVVIHPNFFRFSVELFERYRDDERIMQISSLSPFEKRNHPYSYHFSKHFRCYGAWGTWKRAWRFHTIPIGRYTKTDLFQIIRSYFPKPIDQKYWMKLFSEFENGSRVNWDYWWNFTCYAQNGLCIVPESNFVKNIGYDDRSTHTKCQEPVLCDLQAESIKFPLSHPIFIYADERPEINFRKNYYSGLSLKSRLLKHVKTIYWSGRDYIERILNSDL